MYPEERTTEDKLLDAISDYLISISKRYKPEYSLRLVRHLIKMDKHALRDNHGQEIRVIFERDFPEEGNLTNTQLLWAANVMDRDMSQYLIKQRQELAKAKETRMPFYMIYGGLSSTPNRRFYPSFFVGPITDNTIDNWHLDSTDI